MQYCDRGPVWFGTRGVGAKPPSAAGLLRSLPRLLGDNTTWPVGRCRRGCLHTHFDSPPFLSCADPAPPRPWRVSFQVVWRSLEPPLRPRQALGLLDVLESSAILVGPCRLPFESGSSGRSGRPSAIHRTVLSY
jgi:hypothetical protein